MYLLNLLSEQIVQKIVKAINPGGEDSFGAF